LLVTDKNKLRVMSEDFNSTIEEVSSLINKLETVMEEYKGVGISAIQIGLPYRVFLAGYPEPEVFINPKVLERSSYMKSDFEGCLSCPGVMVRIKRSSYIVLEYTSIREEKFVKIKRKFKDFEARVVQHELDHLNGFLIEDRGKVYRK
jgi:peptide deformylase